MDITSMTGSTNILELFYNACVIIVGIFTAGWVLNKQLHNIYKEDFERVKLEMTEIKTQHDTDMVELRTRLHKVASEAVSISIYERDISAVRDMVADIRTDVREGFASVASRIDTLFSFKTKV